MAVDLTFASFGLAPIMAIWVGFWFRLGWYAAGVLLEYMRTEANG